MFFSLSVPATPAVLDRASHSLQRVNPGLGTSKNFSPFSAFSDIAHALL